MAHEHIIAHFVDESRLRHWPDKGIARRLCCAIAHFIVEARVRTYLDRGKTLKDALGTALSDKDIHWPDQSDREIERLLAFLRRRRKVREATERPRRKPRKPSGRPVCELSQVPVPPRKSGPIYRENFVGEF
jgi:hypothetical protein